MSGSEPVAGPGDGSAGYDELPEDIKKLIGKGATIFRSLQNLNDRGLVYKALCAAWEGKDEAEVHKPIADMSDVGLAKAYIILENVTRAVEVIRHVRGKSPK